MPKIEIIRAENSFHSLDKSWNNLLEKSGCTKTIFQTFDWKKIWWKNYGNGNELFILLVKENNILIGIAPCYIENISLRRIIRLKKLSIIGTGPSEYLDFIIMKGKEKQVLSIIFTYLINNKEHWDVIDFQEVPSSSPTLKYCRRLVLESSTKTEINLKSVCPVLDLPESWDTYLSSLSRKSRKNLRRDMKNLQKNFDVNFNVIDNPEEVDKKIIQVIDLHQQKWSSEGIQGNFTDPSFRAFHLAICNTLSKSRNIKLYTLTLNDELVSALYNYHYDDKIYFYLPGYNKDFSTYSVGRVILGLAIKDSIKKGIKSFDFLRGDEDYKYRFGAKNNENYQINVFSGSTKINFLQPISQKINWLFWRYPSFKLKSESESK